MTYSFLLKMRRPPHAGNLQTTEHLLHLQIGDSQTLVLSCDPATEGGLGKALTWDLAGNGYETEDEASRAGQRARSAFEAISSAFHFAADFGTVRGEEELFALHTPAFRTKQKAEDVARGMRRVRIGLNVYADDPALKPLHIGVPWAHGVSGPNVNTARFAEAFRAGHENDEKASRQEQAARALYAMALYIDHPVSRLLTLVSSIEALIDKPKRAPDVVKHIKNLVRATKESSLKFEDKQLLMSNLGSLRYESIKKSGAALVRARVGDRKFGGLEAGEFFENIYDMRSQVVHGSSQPPSLQAVIHAATRTCWLVGFLLGHRYLEFGPFDSKTDF